MIICSWSAAWWLSRPGTRTSETGRATSGEAASRAWGSSSATPRSDSKFLINVHIKSIIIRRQKMIFKNTYSQDCYSIKLGISTIWRENWINFVVFWYKIWMPIVCGHNTIGWIFIEGHLHFRPRRRVETLRVRAYGQSLVQVFRQKQQKLKAFSIK